MTNQICHEDIIIIILIILLVVVLLILMMVMKHVIIFNIVEHFKQTFLEQAKILKFFIWQIYLESSASLMD